MYTVDAEDEVIPLDEVPQSDIGAPMPIVFGDESAVIVSYYLRGAPLSPVDDRVFVKFLSCRAHSLGPPNDEAFDGHPLADRGLRPYGAYRVEKSSWLRQLERMNEVHPQQSTELFRGYTHYILTFHDSTFECIAKSLSVPVVVGLLPSLLGEFERLWHKMGA